MHRLRHPMVSVYLLGGFLGSGLNLAMALALYQHGWPAGFAFFISTLLNELFHHLYYHVVYVNQEIRLRTPLPLQLLMYLAVSGGAGILFAWFHQSFQIPFVDSVLIALWLLAVLNTTINRISTFSSSKLAMVEYQEMGQSFYDDQTNPTKVNWFRAWFHRSRFERLTRLVLRHYKSGKTIADLGCGNCWWNTSALPVTGVDVNQPMMEWAVERKRLSSFRVTPDLSQTQLPDASMDIVVMSETLEHLLNLDQTIAEVGRILKKDGVFLITVPYDFFLGPFFVLFNINCLWQGYVKGSIYHRYRCGHVNHFTQSRLRETLRNNGFDLADLSIVNGLSLYASARKAQIP
jgi:SAM-dependent methyltransferase